MSRIWFSGELETVATWWRLLRADGVTRALPRTMPTSGSMASCIARRPAWCHRRSAAPPVFRPTAPRCRCDFARAIAAADLVAGRFDGGRSADWPGRLAEPERQTIYRGIGAVSAEANGFTAELQSRKAELQQDGAAHQPRCRARFCGPGCGLSAARYGPRPSSHRTIGQRPYCPRGVSQPAQVVEVKSAGSTGRPPGCASQSLLPMRRHSPHSRPIADPAGARAIVRQGCDHSLATCSGRFDNAVNFRGEPFLPGNDLVIRYGLAQ